MNATGPFRRCRRFALLSSLAFANPTFGGVGPVDLEAISLERLAHAGEHRVRVRTTSLDGVPFDLVLSERDPVSREMRVEVRGPSALPAGRRSTRSWSGRVRAMPGSSAFVATSAAGTFGWVEHGGRRWSISTGPSTTTHEPTTTDLRAATRDGLIRWADHGCDTPDPGVAGGPSRPGSIRRSRGFGDDCLSMVIAVDTDNEYLDLFDGDLEAATGYVETLVAAADYVFERDFGGGLTLGFLRLWQQEDPWTGTDTGVRLTEFWSYWTENEFDVPRDTAHMLSGASLGGGRAFRIGAVDPMLESYAVSGNLNGFFPYPVVSFDQQNWDPFVFLHELGHLLGSPHTHSYSPQIDGCGAGDCDAASGGTIMSYCHQCPGSISNIDLAFHPRVRERMVAFRSEDGDGDGRGDSCDLCPADPQKVAPEVCGCGRIDRDDDGDGVVDCLVEDFNVPNDFPTLQLAVDAAVPGAVIQVAEGLWTIDASLDPRGKDVVIRGARGVDGAFLTTLVAGASHRVVSATRGRRGTTTFEDLRFQGRVSDDDGAVKVRDASIRFRRCEFVGHRAEKGAAINAAGNETEVEFESCRFIRNEAVLDGGVAQVRMRASVRFDDCVFSMNRAGRHGGAIAGLGSRPVLVDSSVICGPDDDPVAGEAELTATCVRGGCLDVDGDGAADACGGETFCAGDIDLDGETGASDLGLMIAAWGPVAAGAPADLDGDRMVDSLDVGILLAVWGACGK